MFKQFEELEVSTYQDDVALIEAPHFNGFLLLRV